MYNLSHLIKFGFHFSTISKLNKAELLAANIRRNVCHSIPINNYQVESVLCSNV